MRYDPNELDLDNLPDDIFDNLDLAKSTRLVAEADIRRRAERRTRHERIFNTLPRWCPHCGAQGTVQVHREESVSLEQGDWRGRYGSGRNFSCRQCSGEFIVPAWDQG